MVLICKGIKGGASVFKGEEVTAGFVFLHLSSAGVLKKPGGWTGVEGYRFIVKSPSETEFAPGDALSSSLKDSSGSTSYVTSLDGGTVGGGGGGGVGD